MTIGYITSTDQKENPANSTGEDLANTVNGLIDLIGAMVERNREPAINPNVNTYTVFDNAIPYSFGDEIRTASFYMRAIKDIPINPGYGFSNQDAWVVFYIPAIEGLPFAGAYDPTAAYPKGVHIAKYDGANLRILKTLRDIKQGELFDSAAYSQVYSYTL